jgi:hypothetical protein
VNTPPPTPGRGRTSREALPAAPELRHLLTQHRSRVSSL